MFYCFCNKNFSKTLAVPWLNKYNVIGLLLLFKKTVKLKIYIFRKDHLKFKIFNNIIVDYKKLNFVDYVRD